MLTDDCSFFLSSLFVLSLNVSFDTICGDANVWDVI